MSLSDVAHIQQALGCTPAEAAHRQRALRAERWLDGLYRHADPARFGAGDFIDLTREENPNVND